MKHRISILMTAFAAAFLLLHALLPHSHRAGQQRGQHLCAEAHGARALSVLATLKTVLHQDLGTGHLEHCPSSESISDKTLQSHLKTNSLYPFFEVRMVFHASRTENAKPCNVDFFPFNIHFLVRSCPPRGSPTV